MSEFTFETLVQDICTHAASETPIADIQDYLQNLVDAPDALLAATPHDGPDETLLFEDDRVSIWHCRFQPGVMVPPHEHLMPVVIGAYAGCETSILFDRSGDEMTERGRISARAGEVIALDKDAVHAVIAEGTTPSEAIHVYMGPLTAIKRDLFDWDTGAAVPFTMEAFQELSREV